MITVLDYGNTGAKDIEGSLSEITADIIISNKESDILNADKLIPPDSDNFSASIKKLQ
jgi:imidazoleglycerol phosphate synthase glutamine amidotransferase subunit HisH